PCEMPIAPADAPSMAEVLERGETLSSKQLVAALLECEKLHGPSTDYRAPNANADESIHPLLSATMSIRQIWPAMRDCYPGLEPAKIRASFSFWLHEDGTMTVDNIKTLRSEGLNADQIACVESSISVAETDLRNGDPEKMGLPAGTVLEMPRIFEIQLKDSATKVTGSGFRPPSHVEFRDTAAYEEQQAQCGSEPVTATLHWDPETGELLDIKPDPAAGAGPCLAELLESQLKPRQTQFFPRTDADTLQLCTFQRGKASCKTEPLFRVVTR
ncbi:MAG: hypothetical protein KUG77_06320, partial [Nannocystaceae bacterium]|nr:hypothetical protein [Nannocystaceae bacterium]